MTSTPRVSLIDLTTPVILDEFEEAVRRQLIYRAQATPATRPSGAWISYTELRDLVDPGHTRWTGARCTGISDTLDRVAQFEHERGRPSLSSLVILKGENVPSTGWADGMRALGNEVPEGQANTYWRIEVAKVLRFWQAQAIAA